ncbi:hypothetical protein EU527_08210 [Candidatus Thorarchaeota archaeon]|nr:MAG: hypothetical protein EU527_08210 [Candidatus Thorarchaeota archaeon]
MGSMKKLDLIRSLVMFAFVALLMIPFVSAQTQLVPNQTLEDQTIWRREDPYSLYEPNLYQVSLDTGHWTVLIDILNIDTSPEVNITVANDIDMLDIIAVSGSGWGNYPVVDFNIESDNTTVYILVHENSLDGDTIGVYDIGVYDDEHLVITATTTYQSQLFYQLIVALVVILVVILVVAAQVIRSRQQTNELSPQPKVQVIPAPQRAIPERYQSKTEVDDGLRMVRIPTECPKCNAPLSHESIDWVGPLEAKCSYCGATVRAKFEKI